MGSELQIPVVEPARRFDTFVILIQGAQLSGVGRFFMEFLPSDDGSAAPSAV